MILLVVVTLGFINLLLFAAYPQKNILKGRHRDPIARDTKGFEITIQQVEEFSELRCQM